VFGTGGFDDSSVDVSESATAVRWSEAMVSAVSGGRRAYLSVRSMRQGRIDPCVRYTGLRTSSFAAGRHGCLPDRTL